MGALKISLKRDLRGRVVAIGTSAAPDRFAAYGYRPDGSPAAERLAGGGLRRFAFDSLRRPVSIDDPAFVSTLGYRKDGASAGPFGDGRIGREATEWKAAAFPGTPPSDSLARFSYDPFGRLWSKDS
jgi:hypothetical protein